MLETDTEAPAQSQVQGFLPELPTIIVAGTGRCQQHELNLFQEMPVNIVVLNHALSKFVWQDNRVIWAVYEPPKDFSGCIPEHLSKVRQIIVPGYTSEPWTGQPWVGQVFKWTADGSTCNFTIDTSIAPPVVPIPYEYQNIKGANVERFNWENNSAKGHANCLCSALAFTLLNSQTNIYLYDIELPSQYWLAKATLQLWSQDKKINQRVFSFNKHPNLSFFAHKHIDELKQSLEQQHNAGV